MCGSMSAGSVLCVWSCDYVCVCVVECVCVCVCSAYVAVWCQLTCLSSSLVCSLREDASGSYKAMTGITESLTFRLR